MSEELAKPRNEKGDKLPSCGYCRTGPLNIQSCTVDMNVPLGEPIPVAQVFFCGNCHATISIQMAGLKAPLVASGAGASPFLVPPVPGGGIKRLVI